MTKQTLLEDINAAIAAHATWKLKLKTAISLGTVAQDPAEVKRDDLCNFGKWLSGSNLDAGIKAGKPYEVVKRLHAEFHVAAASVLEKVAAGKVDEAQGLLDGKFRECSEILNRALHKWKHELTA